MEVQPTPTNIPGAHCQSCGSKDPENIGWEATAARDGYSACCNEIVINNFGRDAFNRPFRCDPRDCYHD